jgi:translation initiation factor IF-3
LTIGKARVRFDTSAEVNGGQVIGKFRFSREMPKNVGPRMNEQIRAHEVRVIGAENDQVGIISIQEALDLAAESGMDLVEVAPEAKPPVCKVMDHGKFKYEQSKKLKKNRASSKTQEIKEIRLGRSVKIDPHDVQIRVDQARKFLLAGHKVLITQRFRGREMAHSELGIERLRGVEKKLEDIAKTESSIKWAGRQATMVLAPDKAKIKRLENAAKEAALAAEESKDAPTD